MIASLEGVVADRSLERVIVDVGGVGYLVHVSGRTLADLPAPGQRVRLLCHTHVREEALQIFGFLEREEQRAFELLIGVSGIGPKLALTMLSGMSVQQIVGAIARADHPRLQSIPGVGKKTAERVVVELRDRCAKLAPPEGGPTDGEAGPARASGVAVSEVVEALTNLGYRRAPAEKIVKRVVSELPGDAPPEELLRACLAAMAEQ